MKIGILTHPQHINYGGILQCYALSTFLSKLGHSALVIRREKDMLEWRWLASQFVNASRIRRLLHRNTIDKKAKIEPFSVKHLYRSKVIHSQRKMRDSCKDYGLDAVIVGSDQVWRADYAMQFGYNYFLDFAPQGVKKVSYAASFGLSTWEYSPDQSVRIKALLSEFAGVSVRENDAVTLCKEHIGIEVLQMPDPTLLLSDSDYDKLASPRLVKDKYVFVYWLGEERKIEPKIAEYESQQYKVIYVGLREQRVLPSVEDWLSYIKYADIVLTDSFHGCVFSIIYKRDTQVFTNESGGNGRLASLLTQFGVSDNIVSRDTFQKSSGVLQTLQQQAKGFLINSLK